VIIPLGTDRPLRRPTLVNHVLVGLNIAVFVAMLVLDRSEPETADRLRETLILRPGHPVWWTFITYAFLHGGFWHLAGNILFLWVFGPNIEDRFGRLGYLVFYLAGGVVAAGLHAAMSGAPILGASGAISAVTGAYLVLFPRTVVRVFVLFYFIGLVSIPAWVFIAMAIAWDVFRQGMGGASDQTAHLAHLGGTGFGMAVSMVLLATRVLPREPYDLFMFLKQAARRREFREASFRRDAEEARKRKTKTDAATEDALALARGAVAGSLGRGEMDAAAEGYRELLERFKAVPRAGLLSRRNHLDLANYLYQTGEYRAAAKAYEVFVEGYPRDAEAGGARVLLGLILARQLGEGTRAKVVLSEALPGLRDEERKVAESLLAELGTA
jgi:membrane associated rhomboid family serine protease